MVVLVGNKTDVKGHPTDAVRAAAESLSKELSVPLLWTSAAADNGVDDAFATVMRAVLRGMPFTVPSGPEVDLHPSRQAIDGPLATDLDSKSGRCTIC